MAITNVGQQTAGATGATTTTNFTAMTLAVNDFIVVVVHLDNQASGTPQTSTITDGHNVWTRQGSSQSVAAGHAQRTEIWTALNNFAGALTINIANSGATTDFCGVASAYRGVDTTTPILDALTFVTNYTATNAATSFVQTVSKTGAMIIGTTTGSSGVVSSASGFGFVDFKSVSSGAGAVNSNAALIDKIGTVGTQTYNWGSNNWACLAGLTLNPFTVNDTGTITTKLTRPSQSLVGKQNYIGTVTTKLTKPSQSVVGKTDVRGAVVTNLTKASQALAGAEKLTATITTGLTKASQAIAAAVEITSGTIVTRLTKAAISATGRETITGAVTTALPKVQQLAQAPANISATIKTALRPTSQTVTGTEQFIGSVVTAIDLGGVHIFAQTYELFIGHIVTHLGQANMAATATEIFSGTAVTRLGASNGSVVANVIQALEIIEGPIVTTLPPFRPLVLGAMLGTPGAAKWFSWRYTDA